MASPVQVEVPPGGARVVIRTLFFRHYVRFMFEWLLLALLGASVWYAFGFAGLSDIDRVSPDYRRVIIAHSWEPFGVLAAVGSILLLIIYYGTSYEVTPFRLFLPFLSKFYSSRLITRSTSDESATSTPVDVEENLDSEKLLDKIADTEVEGSATPGEAGEETVSRILRTSARSAAKLAAKMERRINTHLILGVLVGGAGLAVWWVSFYYGGAATEKSSDLTHYLMGTIPRITILLFIELLAGFFLRQYRIGVEDLKYFLELRRRADAKRIAYAVFERLNDRDAKLAFAKAIMEEKSDTRLASGETTTTLYAMEKEENEIVKGLGVVGDKLEAVAKAFKKEK